MHQTRVSRNKHSQGIRKRRPRKGSRKRSDPNRQRLAKAVTRKDLDDYWSVGHTSANSLNDRKFKHDDNGPPQLIAKQLAKSAKSDIRKISHCDEHEEEDLEDKRFEEIRAMQAIAYGQLMQDLRLSNPEVFSHFENDTGLSTSPRRSAQLTNEYASLIRGPSDLQTRSEQTSAELSSEPGSVIPDEMQANLDLSADAVSREHTHFDQELSKEEAAKLVKSYYPYRNVASVSSVGKISVAVCEPDPKEENCWLDLRNKYINFLGVPPRMIARWKEMLTADGQPAAGSKCPLNDLEAILVRAIRSYKDVLLCKSLSPSVEHAIRQVVVAHVFSHTLRARTRVLRNDQRLKDLKGSNALASEDNANTFLDQGFTRARVLFLVPMRNDAYDIVTCIINLALGTAEGEKSVSQIVNRERFEEEFGESEEDDDVLDTSHQPLDPSQADETSDRIDGKVAETVRSPKTVPKPADWQHRFRGNIDDDFKLGIALSRKSIKLYTDFYNSDIIIASPLGLVRSLQSKKSGKKTGKSAKTKDSKNAAKLEDDWVTGVSDHSSKKRDESSDGFLSSIEICVVDGANVFGMQNWATLQSAMDLINNMPSQPGTTDFTRVRSWALDNLMRFYRQTIVLSAYKKAELSGLFRGLSNHSGQVRIMGSPRPFGTISDVTFSLRQRFVRVDDPSSPPGSLKELPDLRLEFFMKRVVPEVCSSVSCQVLVFVPSYFDFVRVRNQLLKMETEDGEPLAFSSICEYSRASDIARARSKFYHERVRLLVVTERFHYFWRYRLRGATTVIWYGLPENAVFYPEILNWMVSASSDATTESGRGPVQSIAMYDGYDGFVLERIVGASRCQTMVSRSSRSMYLFA